MQNNKEIYSLIKNILIHRFPNISKKQEIQITNKGYKIACPYCGDSKTDETKKRGNVYVSSNTYKCWNDGCFKYTSMGKFLSDYAIMYGLDLSEINLEFDSSWDKSKMELNKKSPNPILEYLFDTGDYHKLLDVNFFISAFGLQPMHTLPDLALDIIEFIERRKLRYGNNYHQLVYYDGSYDKVWLLNIHIPTGKVLGLSYRHVKYKKFKIYTYLTLKEEMGIEIDFEDFNSIVTLGNYFNILNVDFSKPVALTEAQIDGMFVNNCIAIQGVSKTSFLFEYFKDYSFNLMFDFDKAGMAETIKDGLNGHGFLMWTKMTGDLLRARLPDAKLIHKIKDINDLFIYMNKSYNVTVNDFQSWLNKYLTKETLDLFYL